MIDLFKPLSKSEQQTMLDAIPLVTILIAGADGNIDTKEKEWAQKLTKIRSFSYHEELQPFYEKLGETYAERLDELIGSLPDDPAKRGEIISAELEKLNLILPKIDQEWAKHFYDGLVSFARHVARASGGFLRFWSVSKAEKKWISLPMIRPIIIEEEEG